MQSRDKEKTLITHDDHFTPIPPHHQYSIFSFLNLNELPNVARTNKQFSTLVNHDTLWKPPLQKEFNMVLPDSINAKRLYAKLLIEKRKLINFNVGCAIILDLIEQTIIDKDLFNRHWLELRNAPNKITINKIVAKYAKSEQDILDYQHLYENVLTLILFLSSNTINQKFIHELGIAIAEEKMTNEHFDRIIPKIEKKIDFNPKHLDLFPKAFISTLTNICRIGLENIFDLIFSRQPALPKIIFTKQYTTSILHNAVAGEQVKMVSKLLQAGADPNLNKTHIFAKNEFILTPDKDVGAIPYSSPLYDAIILLFQPHNAAAKKIVDILLESGADPNLECCNWDDDCSATPLKLCSMMLPEIHSFSKELDHDVIRECLEKVISRSKVGLKMV